MTTAGSDSGALREKVQELFARHAAKDLPERPFRRALAEFSYKLYNAVAREQLKPGETILQEHHVIQSHMWLARSILSDPDQEIFSFYLTDRRLIRIRSVQVPGRPISCDERDQTKVESLFLDRIEGLRVRRQIRTGEVAVGAVIAAVGFLFGPLLEVTGPVLMGVGILGALHGLLLPSRLVEVQTRVKGSTAPMIIYASRRKSGRKLVRMLRERLASTRT